MSAPLDVRALCFDVFGTVVDFRSGLVARLAEWGGARRVEADWGALADALRAEDRAGMARANEAGAWPDLDAIRLEAMRTIPPSHGLPVPTEDEARTLAGAWREGPPWPDARPGLERLRRRFVLSPLSNGTLATLVALSRHGGLVWDCVLATELVGAFKPDPRVYERAVELLADRPEHVLMVAAHSYDLRAARALGLRTAFVRRPLEFGPGGPAELEPEGEVDLVVDDLGALADALRA